MMNDDSSLFIAFTSSIVRWNHVCDFVVIGLHLTRCIAGARGMGHNETHFGFLSVGLGQSDEIQRLEPSHRYNRRCVRLFMVPIVNDAV